MRNEHLAELSASKLRGLLISEVQQFIRFLELRLPIERLIEKRDYIKLLLEILSEKENVEFDQLVGKYFPGFIRN